MTAPGHGHKTKVCPRCGERKRLSAQNFVYATVGGRRQWKHCRVCDRARQRARRIEILDDPVLRERYRKQRREQGRRRREKYPDRVRASHEKWVAKIKAEDPEHYAEVILIPKRFRRERPADLRKVSRATYDGYVAPSSKDAVSAAPLRAYLYQRFPGWKAEEIHAVVQGSVSPRGLWRVLTAEGNDHVTLDLADRLLTLGLGRPDLLNTIYPMGNPHA